MSKFLVDDEFDVHTVYRAIILMGANAACYKFALARALVEWTRANDAGEVRLEDLALPYARQIVEHMRAHDRQGTSTKSTFLEACRLFKDDASSEADLAEASLRHGFNLVLKHFHVVSRRDVPRRFFSVRKVNGARSLVLTDHLFAVAQGAMASDLLVETNARWNLVETAWANNVSARLLEIKHDAELGLYVGDSMYRRRTITSARGALNGYQRGKCFWCRRIIHLEPGLPAICHVDHFIPHSLSRHLSSNLDGVWNLVLACPQCNLGRSDRLPNPKYLYDLARRNDYLIESHHPLKDTLERQLGLDGAVRLNYLNTVFTEAKKLLIFSDWQPKVIHE